VSVAIAYTLRSDRRTSRGAGSKPLRAARHEVIARYPRNTHQRPGRASTPAVPPGPGRTTRTPPRQYAWRDRSTYQPRPPPRPADR
jgi:hypothetical protein